MGVDVRPPPCGQANFQVSTFQLDMQLLYLLRDYTAGLSLKTGTAAHCTAMLYNSRAVVSFFHPVTVSPVIKVCLNNANNSLADPTRDLFCFLRAF